MYRDPWASSPSRRRRPATCTSSVFVDPNQSMPQTSSISFWRGSTVPAFAISMCRRSNSRRGRSSGSAPCVADPRARVEADVADLDHVGRRRRIRSAAAEDGADAGDQLGHAERLHEVVVGAELEPHDAIGLEPSGGEHDDRHPRRRADRPADVAAVDVGQHEVEQDDVRLVPAHRLEPRRAGRGDLDSVPLALQRRSQRVRDGLLVLDDDHPCRPGRRRHQRLVGGHSGSVGGSGLDSGPGRRAPTGASVGVAAYPADAA